MKKSLIIIGMFGSVVLSHAQIYEANLDGLQEVPPNSSPATGSGHFSLTGTTFSVTSGSYQDLQGMPLSITLDAAPPETNYPILFFTVDTPGATNGMFSGSVCLRVSASTEFSHQRSGGVLSVQRECE